MISNLLLAIRDRLIQGFQGTLPQPPKQIVLKEGFLREDKAEPPTSQQQPSIQLSMGAFELNVRSQERGFVETAIAPITVVREFRQSLGIEIFGSTAAQVESLVSLAIAILLTNHDALLEDYNTGQSSAVSQTEYHTAGFTSLHNLSQFRLLEGVPLEAETGVGIRLKFEVVGQLQMTQTVPESQRVIETIPLTVKLSPELNKPE
ncbi:MAG TPA: hypothetical protein V6D16_09755 [Candidatus Obscuribacterales bacterium]